ncbi:hypothetical protein GO730_00180 [Spirosoma sp. HMF3257]|uniref:Lipoprotein n=1 Tax=Spirosoma telluris TaxID=2183553 RepID=A0A327NE36_9BACT|nr:hypothetical protein [Spirosoma telluris]RAI73225.1 hypothetical protein HMF3257_00180 [Spirosoma telluris]
MNHKYLLLIIGFFLIGCSKRAVIKFAQKPAELTSADILTEIMLVNKSPRIVLRVPNTRVGVTNTQSAGNQRSEMVNTVVVKQTVKGKSNLKIQETEQQYDETALYNAIEKQLFKEGFSVRDRGLFNQVLDSNHSIDYSKIKDFTNTDLILELVSLDGSVGYTTNVCYTDPDGKQRLIEDYRDLRGASVEFKLVHVKTNEIVGSYKLHHTPCLDGCRGMYSKKGAYGMFVSGFWLKPGETKQKKPYQHLDQDELEAFVTEATRELVKTIR